MTLKFNKLLQFAALLAAICFLITANKVSAQEFQSLKSIQQAVNKHLHQQLQQQDPNVKSKITVSKLDARLHLKQCDDHALETYFLEGSNFTGNTTVGVRCASPVSWSLYVPAKVRIFKPVLVTKRPLGRRKTLSKNDIHFIEKDITSLNTGYFIDSANVTGKITKRSLPAGFILTPMTLQAAKLVLRGEDVSIILKSTDFQIRVAGVALMDGSSEQKIRVRNKASKKVLEAIVTGRGVVSVRM